MASRQFAIDYIKKYLKEANNHNLNISQAILFGSYAKDSQNRNSDIDVALVSDAFSDNPLQNRKLLSPLSFKFHKIEPHFFTVKYFNEDDTFVHEIKRTGIKIL